MRLKCNKTDACNGIIAKDKKCPHYGEHDFVNNTTGRPYWKITCNKAEQCLKGDKSAFCEVVDSK